MREIVSNDMHIQTDGRTVWFHSPTGICLIRLCFVSIEVLVESTWRGSEASLTILRHEGPIGYKEWLKFRSDLSAHFRVEIPGSYCPKNARRWVVPEGENVEFVAIFYDEHNKAKPKTISCVNKEKLKDTSIDLDKLVPVRLRTDWSKKPYIWALRLDMRLVAGKDREIIEGLAR